MWFTALVTGVLESLPFRGQWRLGVVLVDWVVDMIHLCIERDWCCARERAFETGMPAVEDIRRRLDKGDGGIEA